MENAVNDRIKMVIKNEGISQEAFAEKIKVPLDTLKSMFKRKANPGFDMLHNISVAYPEYSLKWIVNGVGLMKEGQGHTSSMVAEPPVVYMQQSKVHDRLFDKQDIPLYDIHAAAGLKLLFEGTRQNIINTIRIPNLTKCDGAITITGDSMYPLLKSGDIVIFKEIHNKEYIQFGEIYLISYEINGDEYFVIKYVQRSEKEEHFKLVSYNEHHQPIDIPVASVNAMASVKASIRYNTMQ